MALPFAKQVAAIVDQALYSVSNFTLNILLARWLVEEDFGAFATTHAVFYLIVTIHTAVLTEPMLVYGSRKYRDRILAYYRIILRFHLVLTLALAALSALAALVLRGAGEQSLASGTLGIAVSLLFSLVFYLYRKICYVIERVSIAAAAGGIYFVVIVLGAYALFAMQRLSVFSAFALMGLSALAGSLAVHLWLRLSATRRPLQQLFRSALHDHWRYGRWAVGTAVLIWVPSKIYYLILPYSVGLEANATFRAQMNLIMPVVQANTALANVLLPSLARMSEPSSFRSHLRRSTLFIGLGTLIYWVSIGVVGERAIEFLYDGRYQESSGLLWVLGAIPIFSWLALAERSALRAVERPDLVFWANVVSASVAVTIGISLTLRFGLVGVGISMILCYLTMYVVLRLQRQAAWRRVEWSTPRATARHE